MGDLNSNAGADPLLSSWTPAWPFGHGLSYTTFTIALLSCDVTLNDYDGTSPLNVVCGVKVCDLHFHRAIYMNRCHRENKDHCTAAPNATNAI